MKQTVKQLKKMDGAQPAAALEAVRRFASLPTAERSQDLIHGIVIHLTDTFRALSPHVPYGKACQCAKNISYQQVAPGSRMFHTDESGNGVLRLMLRGTLFQQRRFHKDWLPIGFLHAGDTVGLQEMMDATPVDIRYTTLGDDVCDFVVIRRFDFERCLRQTYEATIADGVALLGRSAYFALLPEPCLRSLVLSTRVVSAAAGSMLLREGDASDEFMVVLSGSVRMVKALRTASTGRWPAAELSKTPSFYRPGEQPISSMHVGRPRQGWTAEASPNDGSTSTRRSSLEIALGLAAGEPLPSATAGRLRRAPRRQLAAAAKRDDPNEAIAMPPMPAPASAACTRPASASASAPRPPPAAPSHRKRPASARPSAAAAGCGDYSALAVHRQRGVALTRHSRLVTAGDVAEGGIFGTAEPLQVRRASLAASSMLAARSASVPHHLSHVATSLGCLPPFLLHLSYFTTSLTRAPSTGPHAWHRRSQALLSRRRHPQSPSISLAGHPSTCCDACGGGVGRERWQAATHSSRLVRVLPERDACPGNLADLAGLPHTPGPADQIRGLVWRSACL